MYQNTQQPYANNYGYAYGAPRTQAKNTQPLTPDQIARLRQEPNAFDMKVEVEDLWRAACTHKEKNGQSTLIQNEDGSYYCTICHETFKFCDCTKEDIEKAVNNIGDMLQTCKTIYLDAPDELVTKYFQIWPLIKKLPALWDRAMKNFAMYDNPAYPNVNPMGAGFSGYAALGNLLSNPYAGYGYNAFAQAMPQQVPGYGQPNGFYGQPAPAYGMPYGAAPVDPSINPMAYGAPGVPAAPAAPAPGVMPSAPAPTPAATPTAPATAEVQQQQVFNV